MKLQQIYKQRYYRSDNFMLLQMKLDDCILDWRNNVLHRLIFTNIFFQLVLQILFVSLIGLKYKDLLGTQYSVQSYGKDELIYLSFLKAKNFHETIFFKNELEILFRSFIGWEKFW